MTDLIPIKKSHIFFYNQFPLYYISDSGEPVLYKKAGKKLDMDKLENNLYPRFFIRKEDEDLVYKKLLSVLNMRLAEAISSKGVKAVKACLCQVIQEALEAPLESSLEKIPETIEIFFFGAKKNDELLDALASINNHSPKIIDHSVNVLTIAIQYCFYKKYPDEKIKRFGLCALLHDLGFRRLDKRLVETDEYLTDEEFVIYKIHTVTGYKDMQSYTSFDKSVALTALEHHERLDGSGYPHGRKNISFEAQVIGIIDSYEPLRYRNKNFRKALLPYEALEILKKDVLHGKYNKQVFVDLCSCLVK